MYKLLLCWRYLLTRYLALLCIVSVMLGVATLIVVNSVMSGFSTKLKDRLHGLLSDLVVESMTFDGFNEPDEQIRRIRQSPIGDRIEAMTATVEVPAMLQIPWGNEYVMKPVRLIGVDATGRAGIGGFAEHLVLQKDSHNPTFEPSEEALAYYRSHYPIVKMPPSLPGPDGKPPPAPAEVPLEVQIPHGIYLGHAIAFYRDRTSKAGERAEDVCVVPVGTKISIIAPSGTIPTNDGGEKLNAVRMDCIVTDYFKSEMSEYDSNYVFVSLDFLQRARSMDANGKPRATAIQIKLKDYRDAKLVEAELVKLFPQKSFLVQTWEEKQGPLLAAISIEKGILNVLLFLIVGVAGFGILAIFSMIVAEKTRDIGILKSLGASDGGVMSIFLGYGLLLGMVGAGLGSLLGLFLTNNINQIEQLLTKLTGQEIFDRTIYYFSEIPTDIQPSSILLVNLGAVLIAVLFSILPALRAATLHPVRALRYE